jgi:hypothetical protein
MINFDLKIERISNGYIVLNDDAEYGDGDATEKRYYPSMEELYAAKLHNAMTSMDVDFSRGNFGPGGNIRFQVSLNHVSEHHNDPFDEQTQED